jgi:hypothetical protein
MQKILFGLCSKHISTIPYYHQPPKVEYFNNNLCAALITHHRDLHTSLDEDFMYLQLAFNTAKHETIGTTALEVIFPFPGRHAPPSSMGHQPAIPRYVYNDLSLVRTNLS